MEVPGVRIWRSNWVPSLTLQLCPWTNHPDPQILLWQNEHALKIKCMCKAWDIIPNFACWRHMVNVLSCVPLDTRWFVLFFRIRKTLPSQRLHDAHLFSARCCRHNRRRRRKHQDQDSPRSGEGASSWDCWALESIHVMMSPWEQAGPSCLVSQQMKPSWDPGGKPGRVDVLWLASWKDAFRSLEDFLLKRKKKMISLGFVFYVLIRWHPSIIHLTSSNLTKKWDPCALRNIL